MGHIYIFRGIAGTGKTTLSNMLAGKLQIPVIRKDDIWDALPDTENEIVNNPICYNILCSIVQTNLDLHTNFIVDVALGDKSNAKHFFQRLNFSNNKVTRFLLTCDNEGEWRERHLKRLKNPTANQNFTSFEHVQSHYKNIDSSPFEDEHIVDTSGTLEESFSKIHDVIGE